jgi:DNA-binding CsgD family transcriptional regulator
MAVPELSPTEERIVLLSASGLTTREIAGELGLEARTIEWHLVRAARKLQAADVLRQHVQRAVHRAREDRKEHLA